MKTTSSLTGTSVSAALGLTAGLAAWAALATRHSATLPKGWGWLASGAGLGLLVLLALDFSRIGFVFAASVTAGGAAAGAILSARRFLPSRRVAADAVVAMLAVVPATLAFVWHQEDLMSWDPAATWEATRHVADFVRKGDVPGLAVAVVLSLPHDYTLLSRVPPGLFLAATDPYSTTSYLLATVLTGTVPAVLVLAAAHRSLNPNAVRTAGVLPVLFLIGGVPLLMTSALIGMPDAAGLVIVVPMFVLAHRSMKALSLGAWVRPEGRRALLTAGLVLGVLAGAAFLYRRWYGFSSLGLAAGLIFECTRAAYCAPRGARLPIMTGFLALSASGVVGLIATIIPFTALRPLIGGFRNYVQAHELYRSSLLHSAELVILHYGPVATALSAAGLVLGLRSRATSDWMRLLLLTTVAASAFFMVVQSPSSHHLFLLVPLIGLTSLAALSRIAERGRARAVAAIVAALVAMVALDPVTPRALPSVIPKKRNDMAELRRFERWIATLDAGRDDVCMLAAEWTMNVAAAKSMWTISPMPGERWKNEVGDRFAQLPDVDGVQGPPGTALMTCRYAVLLDPPQLVDLHQASIRIPTTDIISGTGLGGAFGRTDVSFAMQDGRSLVVYARTRATTEAEFADLHDRFYRSKGSREAEFRRLFQRPN